MKLSFKKKEYIECFKISNQNSIMMPNITKEKLDAIQASNNLIAIGHKWFSQGSYKSGFYYTYNETLEELQTHPQCKIVNENEEFIFESGTLDYKGLIAIEVPSNVDTCYINSGRDFNNDWEEKISFKKDTPIDFKRSILKNYLEFNNKITIQFDQEFLFTVEEYNHIIANFNVTII